MKNSKINLKSYDTIVIGGGIAGTIAAISAARLGNKVALIQDRPVLGGNASSEVRLEPSGASARGRNRNARETGIIEELRMEIRYRNMQYNPFRWSLVLYEWAKKEVNIDLYLNTKFTKVSMKKCNTGKIASIDAVQLSNEKFFRFISEIYIDATGDGIVAAKAGADYRFGRESEGEHDENLAPKKSDKKVRGSTLMFSVKKLNYNVSFNPPLWAKKFLSCSDLPLRDHEKILSDIPADYWWIEYGGILNTIKDNEEIRDELLRIIMGIWDHIKNHCVVDSKNHIIDWIGSVVGKRESRRILGEYILTQKDLQSQKTFHDRIAYGGWPLDDHPPEGIESKSGPSFLTFLPGLYCIPFRCLYSRNIENLMMAGRNISVTHIALGSPRVMATCGLLGQVVGTASYFCKKYKAPPKEIYKSYIRELQQQLLKDNCYIIGLKNEDCYDLALKSKVSDSSSMPLLLTKTDNFQEINQKTAQMFCISESKIKDVSLYILSKRYKDITIQLGLRESDLMMDFNNYKEVAVSTIKIPAKQASWVRFQFNCWVNPKKIYWIWLSETAGIYWGYSKEEYTGTCRGIYNKDKSKWEPILGEAGIGDEWKINKATFNFKINPIQKPYSGENVTNGISRTENHPNIFISNPFKGFPQYIDLDFGKMIKFNTVYIVFDTDLDCPMRFESSGEPKMVVSKCVKDYTIYLFKHSRWEPILNIYKNYQYRRIHYFKTKICRKLRLKIHSSNGSDSARVFEIRVYNEKR